MLKCVVLLTLSALAVMFIAGCRGRSDAKPIVTVSIEPQKWLLERIAGDRVEVRTFLQGDADPENFDPSVSTLIDASRSAAFMRVGHLPWEEMLISKVAGGNNDMLIVNTSEGIEPITGTHSHSHGDGSDEAEEIDPHVWGSVKNAKVMASNMFKGLVAIDPAGADYYERRYMSLNATLDSLDREFSVRLRPLRGSSFLVWHPSLSYFARDYGLNQIAVGSENKEISIPAMQSKIDEAASHDVRVFFVQPQMDSGEKTAIVASGASARTAVIHPLSPDWMGEMEAIVNALTEKRISYDER